MYPTLFKIGSFAVTSFGLMMFLSFIAGGWVLSKQLARRGQDPGLAWDVLAWLAIGGIVGAKVYYLALHWQDFAANPLGEALNRGGLVWYGGFIGGALAYYWQIRKHDLPIAVMFDATAPALALAQAVGRIGCFLVGDDYGLPTRSWVGIAFPNGSPPSTAENLRAVGAHIPATVPGNTVLAVHPTQLYESAACLVMFFVLWKLSERKLRPGQLFGAYLGMYGVERFFIEFVRAKGDRFVLGLSTSQICSILLVAAAIALWTRGRGRSAVEATAPKPRPATHAGVPR